MVDLYNILYKYAGDPASPEYKAPLNQIYLTFRAYQPEAAILDFSYHAPPVVRVN